MKLKKLFETFPSFKTDKFNFRILNEADNNSLENFWEYVPKSWGGPERAVGVSEGAFKNRNLVAFAVTEICNDKEIISFIILNEFHKDINSCEIEFCPNNEYSNLKLSAKALNELANELFFKYDFNRLEIKVFSHELNRNKILEKSKYVKECVKKQHTYNGKTKSFFDLNVYGIISNDLQEKEK